MRRLAYLGALALTVGAGALFAASRSAFEFPHEKHAALGGSGCETCHAGIYSGDASRNVSADPALCAGCHNGQMVVEVDWEGYTPQESGLKFEHATHPKLGCQTCHGVEGGEGEMAVQAASGDTCLACHGKAITPQVLEQLDARYPDDRARGYGAGEIRGAFSLSKTLP